MTLRAFPAVVIGSLLFAAVPAVAQTATDPFDVSITIANSCTVQVDDMSFGTVSTLTSAEDASTTGSVTCSNVAPVAVSFNVGTGGGALTGRLMSDGTDTIEFNLYRDIAHTEVLGDGTGGTVTVPVTTTGAADAFTIYGLTTAGQGAKPVGTYSSTVTATVTF